MITKKQIAAFQKTVWDYYTHHKRPMPWRSRVTPYRVLVSEVMLQQTQVDRVIPKFNAWMKRFPNFEALAVAPTRDVLSTWSGLGYNRRALNLQRLAKIAVGIGATNPYTSNGLLPHTIAELDALPGIGPATAAAICVYAFNQPHAFIETNVRAVYIHHFFTSPTTRRGGVTPPLQSVSDTDILPLVEQTLDTTNPREWFWAIMDYGSHLKKQHKNPSRRSSHYAKQSKFEGSNRQLRGKILKLLIASPGKARKFSAPTVGDLAKSLNISKQKIAPVVAQLCADGFVIQKKSKLFIANS